MPLAIHSEPLSRQVPDARLTRLPGIGHMPHHVALPEVLAALDRVAPGLSSSRLAHRCGVAQDGRERNAEMAMAKAKNDKSKADGGFDKPFDGAVSRFVDEDAPKALRKMLRDAHADDILDPDYPYREEMDGDAYDAANDACQLELAKLQRWVRDTGHRVALVFEGRDAAGKGGAIRRLTENLNPRHAPVVALPAPSDTAAHRMVLPALRRATCRRPARW